MQYLGIAAKNVRLERSVSKGETDLDLVYKGRYFRAGSSIRYMIRRGECSIFTSEADLAEDLGFQRIDKFEYEKTIRLAECDAVRITHKDPESEAVFFQHTFSPLDFMGWLDMLKT